MNETSTIHFDLPTNKKATYVRAARRNEQKLIPWVLDALDVAATDLGLAQRLLQFAQTQPAGMTPAAAESAHTLAIEMLRAIANSSRGSLGVEAAYLFAVNAWRRDPQQAREYLIEAAALGHAEAAEWVATLSRDGVESLTNAVEQRRAELESDGD